MEGCRERSHLAEAMSHRNYLQRRLALSEVFGDLSGSLISNSPRQRLVKTNTSTLQCAVKHQNSHLCGRRETLNIVQEKAQN